MEVRITFISEVYLKGETLDEIKEKWLELSLYSEESQKYAFIDYIDLVSVEDAETNKDIMIEWKEVYV